jgi:4-aminobutyrate aminotransferase-like enzyme
MRHVSNNDNDLAAVGNFGADIIPDVIVGAQGSEYITSNGRRLLDWTSGQVSGRQKRNTDWSMILKRRIAQMASLLGHCHPEVTESIRAASETIDHISSCMLSPPVLTLANRLTSLDKAVFYSTGSESNEAAIRLAKVVTGRFEIVGLGQSWHGMSAGAQGAQYNAGRRGHGNLLSA